MKSNKSQLTAIIIDDEPSGIKSIERVLINFPAISVISSFSCGDEAIIAINNEVPDIVFLDIDMPGKSGFDVVDATKSQKYKLVFVTAHEHYALKAFETHAIDYLLKPVRPSRLEKCLKKITDSMLLTRPPNHNIFKQVIVNDGKSTHIINPIDILSIESIGRYQKINLTNINHLNNNHKSIITDKTMTKITLDLPDDIFIRIHRCHIINIKEISSIIRHNRKKFVTLNKSNAIIPIARGKEKELELLLNNGNQYSEGNSTTSTEMNRHN